MMRSRKRTRYRQTLPRFFLHRRWISVLVGIYPFIEERFFRNLLLGEKWDLRNRYLHVHATDEWKVQPNLANNASTPQVRDNHPTSTPQVKDKLHTSNTCIRELIKIIGDKEMSVKEMLAAIGLKERKNFLCLYLNPAISEGYVCLLYPSSPATPARSIF